MSQQKKNTSKAFLTGIEKLVNQILFVSDVPCQQICHEHVGKRVFPVKHFHHGLLVVSHHGAIGHCGCGAHAEKLPRKANRCWLTSTVLADAGGRRTADVRVFINISPAADGLLHLNFSSVKGGRAMVSAIELLPGIGGQLRPVRIVARDVPYYSDDSRWWSADMYFKNGQLRETEQTVTGTDDPELYTSERWGHFSYAIPVAPGKYAVSLYFIERSFRAAHRQEPADPGASSGMRLFNVFCNRKLLLRDVNILEEVGENRPLVRKFTGLEPNAQGELLLEFVPTRDYATVSAIEVVPQ